MRFYTLSLWVSFQLSLHVEGNLYCLVMLLRKTHKAWKWVSTISRFWLGHEIQAWDFKMMSTISSFWLFMHETSKWCPLYRVFDFSSVRLQNGVHYIEFLTFQVWDFKMVSTISSFWLFKCENSNRCHPLYHICDFQSWNSCLRLQTGCPVWFRTSNT